MKSGQTFNLIQEAFSRTYHWVTGADPYPMRTLLAQEYQHRAPGKILDVGCGSGCYALDGYDYTGIDPNPSYIAFCEQRRRGHFICMRGDTMTFPNESFDTVLCFSVGHHLNDQQLQVVLGQVGRVLKKNGVFYFADVVRPILKTKSLAKLLEWLDEGDCFRTETEYSALLAKSFVVECRQELVDQFFRTVFLRCRKR